MGYSRAKKKNRAKRIIAMLVMMGVFSTSAITLGMKMPSRMEQLEQVRTAVKEAEAEATVHTQQLEVLSEQVGLLNKQVEDLRVNLDKVQKEQPELAQAMANVSTKNAYLTFDDGPSDNTLKILDFLKVNNIKATFFVIGKQNMDHVYKRIVDEGHTLAIHSNTHDYSGIYQNVGTFMEDINTLANQLENATGVRPTIMRFPGGSNNTVSHRYGGKGLMDQIIQAVNEAGYVYFDWNVDSLDASAGRQDVNVIVDSVLKGSQGKQDAIILMHDAAAKTTTVDALPDIVTGLRQKGFVFEKITEDTPIVQFK